MKRIATESDTKSRHMSQQENRENQAMGQITRPFALALSAFTFIVLTACGQTESAQEPEQVPVTVRTALVSTGTQVAEPLRFSGIVQAQQRATLTFQVSGNLVERAIELGEKVEAGDTLARLYNPGLEPARASARARLKELATRLDQAQREWDRSSRLREKGVVSEQSMEQLTARRDGLLASVATAEAELAEANQMLNESILKAPFGGRVEALLVERDEFVGAGQPVMRLSSPNGREVEVRIPAFLLSQISVGQLMPVWSVLSRDAAPVIGKVTEIAQAGSVRGELHPLLVSLPEETLQPGEPVEVGIVPAIQGEIRVPVLAVMQVAEGNSVFRIAEGHAQRVAVTVHRIIGEHVVVSSESLSEGDRVVYAGLTRLADGDAVEILP
ncbi:MAG: efflux RND transporter periplasmic adaptor subunit [Marinobacter sp.]|uniref:efflux RND transporter periplasmic adaptor subunit n=1 Tax=Marinobacter sp. TaxID=50741 RepID=UPI0034A04D35